MMFCVLPVLCCLFSLSLATVMGDLAASMQPGTWAELTTQNFGNNAAAGTNDLLKDAGGHHILQYTDDAQWDPVKRQFLFIGQGHSSNWDSDPSTHSRFICYTDSTNSWTTLSDIPTSENNLGHAYDHSAIDPAGRAFYHRPYSSTTVYKFNLTTLSWSTLPQITTSVMEYNNCCVGVDWFPEMKCLIYASLESGSNGSVIRWNSMTNAWARVGPGKNLPIGAYHHFSEYNPVYKVMLFGGGNGSSDVYKLDSAGVITKLANGPVNIGINSTVFTVDPVSGQHLLFTNAETFYKYDLPSDAWTLMNAPKPPIFNNSDAGSFGIVATPVSTYGVVMFVYWAYANSKVYLYKHSASGTSVESPSLPSAGNRVSKAVLFDIRGKRVAELNSAGSVADLGLPAGVYIQRTGAGAKATFRRVVVMK